MMNKLQIIAKVGLSALLIAGAGTVYAQKLPTTQEGGVWAPVGVKVDGKLAEWNPNPLTKLDGFGKDEGKLAEMNNYFKAYNKTTNFYYTMANDDNNLYLVVKSAIAQNNMKIMAGGITLAINTEGKKKDKDAYQVTFPIVNRGQRGQRGPGGGGGQRVGGVQIGGGGGGQRQAPDSAQIAEMRKQQVASIKELKVLGFKEITDTTISIYNEYGIKAAANFDEQGLLFYELSIPLKLMNIAPGAKELAYNLKVNGIQFTPQGGFGGPPGGGGGGGNRGGGGGGGFGGGGNRGGGGGGGFNMQDMMSPTDFWGKYTLAAKQ